jgi:ribosomal 30S subunit maturation factor RimM
LKTSTHPNKQPELKGSSIFLEKTVRPKLKRGEFYDDEVVNLPQWKMNKQSHWAY